jgi:serine/threonine-protein kinase
MTSQPALPAAENNLPKVGDLLVGKYRIESVLGQGGMGIVYAATHELLCQRVAVKLLLTQAAQNPDAAGRFLNEARAAARIQAENVARVSDVGMLDTGIPYMVMEFLDGIDLNDLLAKRGRLPIPDAVDYLLQATEAVAQAHALGIVHRDLKPANLFLARRPDGTSLVKVLDFGISKTTGVLGQSSSNTSTQSLLGSPYYMSPEQLRSSKNVDRRTDIWSLGVILYELLTGAKPYVGETIGALFAAILEQEPRPLSLLRADAPPALDAVFLRCLRRNPDERWSNTQELAIALAPFCTARGGASIDRIVGIGAASGAPSLAPQVGSTTARGQTAASWGTSRATPPKSSRGLAIAVALGVGVVSIGGAFVIARVFLGGPSTTEARPSYATAAATEAAPSAASTQPSVAPSAAATASASASGVPVDVVAPAPEPEAASADPAQGSSTPRAASAPPAHHKPRPTAPAAPKPAPHGYDPSKDTRR